MKVVLTHSESIPNTMAFTRPQALQRTRVGLTESLHIGKFIFGAESDTARHRKVNAEDALKGTGHDDNAELKASQSMRITYDTINLDTSKWWSNAKYVDSSWFPLTPPRAASRSNKPACWVSWLLFCPR